MIPFHGFECRREERRQYVCSESLQDQVFDPCIGTGGIGSCVEPANEGSDSFRYNGRITGNSDS